MNEAQFQRQVVDLAWIAGWLFVHHRPARTAHGWRTPVEGPLGAGWPDLVLVSPRRKRVLYVELKADKGRLSPAQAEVHAALREAGAEVRVWRPRDFDAIAAELTA